MSARPVLDALTTRRADLDVIDDDGTEHRLWAVPADGDDAAAVAPLLAAAAAGPLTIADGHHRYETALRYRDERRMSRSCEEDPAFDYVLTLFLDAAGQPLTVLPTHRVVRGLGDDGVAALLDRLDELFEVERGVGAPSLLERFESAGLAERRRRSVRAVDARRRRAAHRPPRRARAVPARGRAPPCAPST